MDTINIDSIADIVFQLKWTSEHATIGSTTLPGASTCGGTGFPIVCGGR